MTAANDRPFRSSLQKVGQGPGNALKQIKDGLASQAPRTQRRRRQRAKDRSHAWSCQAVARFLSSYAAAAGSVAL